MITTQRTLLTLTGLITLGLMACGPEVDPAEDLSDNPFLEEQGEGKEDTGYLNAAGVETHVTLEADVVAPSYDLMEAPPYLAQYTVTYLRKRYQLYIELLAEDAAAPDRVEWLVDGKWLTAAQARTVPPAKLKRFRLAKVNAVMLNQIAKNLKAGQIFKARIPLAPYTVMAEAQATCADSNPHIELDASTYWYLWNPDRAGCKATLQDMTVTVDEVLPKNPPSYPEYHKLWADGRLDVVVVFGKLDEGTNIQSDYNWANADRFVTWLKQAGFSEAAKPKLGRRFTRAAGDRKTVVDVFYPNLFHDVADYAHLKNWQAAVKDHEVVIYLGHSVLGTGMAFDQIQYPQGYQIFLLGGCLAYEYYVRPVLQGKGSWANVDVISSIVENGYGELSGFTGAFLAKLFWGFEHQGQASWQQIMSAINKKLGHSHFGVSGARGNCFTPGGTSC